jgi:succinate dehydrogenase/fumarate reductase flavoprotein subunit
MVHALSAEACARLEELVSWGVPFLTHNGGIETQPSAGHRYARGCYTVKNIATEVARPVRAQVDRRGIAVFDHLMLQQILVDHDHCCGVLGLHRRSGETCVVYAPAVIIATGGGAEVYAQTTNVSGVTGDGLAMALRAGVELVDMEFVQYYPVALRWPVTRLLASPTLFPLGAKLYNRLGERFMATLPQGTENVTRDVRSRAIFYEIAAGRGINDDAVIMSLADINTADFRRYAPDMAHIAEIKHIDYQRAQFLVRPEAHFFCGGIRTDAWGATTLPGLYAVGEAAGGCHGANRLANNAFTECYVFGKRAGEHAAAYVKSHTSGTAGVATLVQQGQHSLAQHLHQTGTALDHKTFTQTLRQTMWEHVGVIRRASTLRQALETIRTLTAQARTCSGDRPAAVIRCLELDNLCLTAEAIALAALRREESRGTHYREDFPDKDEASWHCNLLVRQQADGTLQVSKEPVIV